MPLRLISCAGIVFIVALHIGLYLALVDANDAIQEIIEALNTSRLKDEDGCCNIRIMIQAN